MPGRGKKKKRAIKREGVIWKKRGKIEGESLSMCWRDDTDPSVFAPILRRRTIVLLRQRRRKRTRAIRRLARRRGQRVPRRRRGRAVRRADARYVRQVGITPDPARKIVQRALHR